MAIVNDLQRIWEGVSQKELVVFFQQLATLVEARVPAVSAIRTIEDQTENRYYRIIVKEMSDDIEDVSPFSVAIEKHSSTFSAMVINMFRAGDTYGQ